MTEQRQVGSLITRELAQQGPCTWEALVSKLSACSWNQLFVAIDALSREGTIILQPQGRFQYLVGLASPAAQAVQQCDCPDSGAERVQMSRMKPTHEQPCEPCSQEERTG